MNLRILSDRSGGHLGKMLIKTPQDTNVFFITSNGVMYIHVHVSYGFRKYHWNFVLMGPLSCQTSKLAYVQLPSESVQLAAPQETLTVVLSVGTITLEGTLGQLIEGGLFGGGP